MSTLYLIRHGQASFGADDYDQLSDLGRDQARATGEYLQQAGIFFDAAYSGELRRQRDTAELALSAQAGPVPLEVDHRFNEIDNDGQIRTLMPVIAERNAHVAELVERGLSSSKDYQKVIDAVFNFWVSDECVADGIESWTEYSGKVRDALADIMRRHGSGSTVAVFTSGGTIATAVSQVLGLDGTHAYRFYEPVFNCSITQCFYSGSRISLSYFNDCSFLRMMGTQQGRNLVSYR